ncbi:MAG: HAD family hydrolase [Nitrospinales bacterium]
MGKARIRALVLDYGGVISQPQNPDNVNNILQILSQDDNYFKNVYQSIRDNYDNGQLSGEEYWLGILQHYGLEQNDSKVTNLIQEDVKSWTQINDPMIQFIKESRGKLCKLAIISNMTRDTLEFMKKHFHWLDLFDELIFSCEFGKNKPDTSIYEACLRRIEIPPQECLFVDDSEKNVEGAMESGMKVIHFKSFLQFRLELDQNYHLSQ